MDKQLKEAMALIAKKCKEPNHYQQMESKSLPQRVGSLHSEFLHFVDTMTINYHKTQLAKANPEDWDSDEYTHTELSKAQVNKTIEALHWLEQSVKACINHLEG